MVIKYIIIIIALFTLYSIITNICDAYVTVKYFEEKKNETILSPLPTLKNNRYVTSKKEEKAITQKKPSLEDIPYL